MFKKILIANRGEIACRVITHGTPGWASRTVAVYSDADRDALHVEHWPTRPVAYRRLRLRALNAISIAEKISAAALRKQTGAEAVHPGYGFLSEHARASAEALAAAAVSFFIGPNARRRSAPWADKSEAKALAIAANGAAVPGVPRRH
jgi:acetyl/propionyl-CoA carboxylase alpha subunit